MRKDGKRTALSSLKARAVLMELLGTVKDGASFIIHHSNVPTIPVFLKDTGRFMPRGSKLVCPGKLSVTFGAPLDFSTLKGIDERHELYQRISQQIRQSNLDLQEDSRCRAI